MRILLIEDDELIAQQIVSKLTHQNYTIDVAADGQTGLDRAADFPYDLILLDVMLSKINGISICRKLRSQVIKTPILLLTAQDNSTNKVMGLDAGADDYLTKPFDLQELSARIGALLRRGNTSSTPILKWGDLSLVPSICEVTFRGRLISLTPQEYSLLELFLRNKQRVFSRSAILDCLWSFEISPGEETVTAQIKRLRHKLKSAGLTENPIETVYGIGYRLKTPKSRKRKTKVTKQPEASSPEIAKQAIEAATVIWQRVKNELDSRVATIEQVAQALCENHLEDELRQQAITVAHKLAGSLGMFDLDEGSRLAREIERILQCPQPLNQEQKQHFSELLMAMQQELAQATGEKLPGILSVDERPFWLIVEEEQILTQQFLRETKNWKIRCEVVPHSKVARELIARKLPEVVLLNLAGRAIADNELTLLEELSACNPPIPVLVLGAKDNLLERVKISRLGGRGFLPQTMSPQQIFDKITQVLQRVQRTETKILAVDDDPLILNTLHQMLEPWGIKVLTLEDSLQFWSTLEAVAPDLLILDLTMPHISGLELCQVVRNDRRWAELPILFLTVHKDTETMQQVFAAGADDYLSKPIVPPELLSRIHNRLERSQLLRARVETDALTGINNRYQFTQELTKLLQLAKRCPQTICFALLNLDSLHQINDRYGHEIGDRLLAHWGRLLQKNFPSEDLVARWGGAEFVVAMYGMTYDEGRSRLSELRETLHQVPLSFSDLRTLTVTFSAGVVQSPHNGTQVQELYQAAKALLVEVKALGSNGIISAKE
ncbi:Diguanylate cyclase (GGDEF) domain-containing protein [Hyella patelloides LEGE 07179]|uniref:Diguanylate cyclase (GGDEF) domain-containing protein n=1 Tax=Hyella patelloides LEGE 07179 TaxID=945734 RepID=A0A563VPJ4_9CYAN|nr:response regulator [Hyella patelloides]VEP13388.1 Diguanylate cyclase (GGDEF) domain-containing protein [Hyella patelloides LEGE 07179]